MRRSIRGLLLGWLLIPLVGLLLLSGIHTYYRSLAIANEVYDRALYDSVLTLGVLITSREGAVVVDLPMVARQMIEMDPMDKIYFAIRTSSGELVAGDGLLPGIADQTALTERPIYRDTEYRGQPIRIAVARLMTKGTNSQAVIVEMAETTRKREAITREILSQSVLPQVISLALTIVVVWLAIRLALGPLYRISSAMDRRSGSDLRPMSVEETPKEIQPLIVAFNNLMQRVADSFALQRRFVSNAAHQLRTPVAGMQALIEAEILGVPSEKVPPVIARMHHSALRMSRLVKQLLALSRSEPGTPVEKMELELGAVAARSLHYCELLAAGKGIRLDSSIDPEVVVKGDPLLLGELIKNLLDNAIRYSPAGSRVVLELRAAGDFAELKVIDEGPGIGAEESERVFERFYRGEHSAGEGSGLGLAIVREIAEAHGATIRLLPRQERSGTIAVATFALVHQTVST